ncbi:MAG: hypothetical protein M1829_001624 [Trizodia sp. TS-e1964]|nr:MAG: hypothetical protein M1829_001624 [Trizodia sp. TS-e1964]
MEAKNPPPGGLTIVIKLGTSSIVNEVTHEPLLSILTSIVETAVGLLKAGHRVVIVSSGAIGVGLRRMDQDTRPTHLPRIQALAAVGQCRLMSLWDNLFSHLRQPVAQILLTRGDIANPTQYMNAKNTFKELFALKVIPIVNENDTLAVSEIKFGDNDTLSAITAAMVDADYLFLMTDVDCLYDKNPRKFKSAQPIRMVYDIEKLTADVESPGSALGTGGMSTKIVAAKLATSAGVTTIITKSSNPGNIASIINYRDESPEPPLHTCFVPDGSPIRDRHFWLLYGLSPNGTLYIDATAYASLADRSGLLASSIIHVEGTFGQQEAVRLLAAERIAPQKGSSSGSECTYKKENPAPLEFGRAVVNYSAAEIMRIRGAKGSDIQNILGYADSEFVALKENIGFYKVATPVSPLWSGNGPNGMER